MLTHICSLKSRLLYLAGAFLAMTLIIGCGDSVPASPNPLPPPKPGLPSLHDPDSVREMIRARKAAREAGVTPKAKTPRKR